MPNTPRMHFNIQWYYALCNDSFGNYGLVGSSIVVVAANVSLIGIAMFAPINHENKLSNNEEHLHKALKADA